MSLRDVFFRRRGVVASACFAVLLALRAGTAAAVDPAPEPDVAVPPEVARLRAAIEEARGKRPALERIVTMVVNDGRTKTLTTVRSGENVRSTFEDGPFVTGSGEFDGQEWHQNANGMTVLDQPRHGGEASEKRTISLAHVTTPFVADVIADLDPKGDGTKTYVDPATSRIVRVDAIAPTQTTVTTYDDFRATGDYVRPWHGHSSDGQPTDERDERTVAISTTGITESDFAIPAPRRALVTFPADVTTVKLPAQLQPDRHFIVRVRVGSRGLDLILDTGAAGIVLDRTVATSLGLKLFETGSNAANAGRYKKNEAVIPEMDVGDLKMKDVAVGVIPSLQFQSPDAPVRAVGLLGFDFIASLALTLDYERGDVTATDYNAFKPPSDPNTIALPIRVGNQGPETDVTVDGNLGERFQIDTGGVGGLMINDIFTRRYPGITRGMRDSGRVMQIGGVGGSFDARLYTIPDLRLGTTKFTNFSALVIGSDRLYAQGGFDGIVGPELLQYFTVTTDYADSTIYLTPNALGEKSLKAGR